MSIMIGVAVRARKRQTEVSCFLADEIQAMATRAIQGYSVIDAQPDLMQWRKVRDTHRRAERLPWDEVLQSLADVENGLLPCMKFGTLSGRNCISP